MCVVIVSRRWCIKAHQEVCTVNGTVKLNLKKGFFHYFILALAVFSRWMTVAVMAADVDVDWKYADKYDPCMLHSMG